MSENFNVIEIGTRIPPLVKHPTTRQLVMWAGASGDYNPIHYDKDFAVSQNLPGVVVPGQLITAFLGQMLADWMGTSGCLRKLAVSYKGMNFPGDAITCCGVVAGKSSQNGYGLITLEVWAENSKGERTVVGTAVVEFPCA